MWISKGCVCISTPQEYPSLLDLLSLCVYFDHVFVIILFYRQFQETRMSSFKTVSQLFFLTKKVHVMKYSDQLVSVYSQFTYFDKTKNLLGLLS